VSMQATQAGDIGAVMLEYINSILADEGAEAAPTEAAASGRMHDMPPMAAPQPHARTPLPASAAASASVPQSSSGKPQRRTAPTPR
jgi:hypothetical protein